MPARSLTDRALLPLDAVRRGLWRVSARTRLGRACVRDRSLRLGVMASGHIVVACALAFVAPLWLLLLGPLLLGVPHVVSDLRYLVACPIAPLPRRLMLVIGTGLIAMTAFRLILLAAPRADPRVELLLGFCVLQLVVGLSQRQMTLRTSIGVVLVGLVAWLALANPVQAVLVVAYAHNVVAFALWLCLARQIGPWRHIMPAMVLYGVATALILGGAADFLVPAVFLGDAGGLTLGAMTETLAPGVDAVWATRLVTWFAFSQAVHYVVWLRLVPQQQALRDAPPTWRRSARDLRTDFGRYGFVLIVVLSLGVPLWALLGSPTDVRALYLAVVVAHGWLEISVFVALLSRPAFRPHYPRLR